jgi:hypothetical protein
MPNRLDRLTAKIPGLCAGDLVTGVLRHVPYS